MPQLIHNYVDTAIFTIKDSCLQVLLLKRPDDPHDPYPGEWALPGGYIQTKIDLNLEGTAKRKLKEKTGVDSPYLEKVDTFGGADRDPRGWSITVVYLALLRWEDLRLEVGAGVSDVAWFPVDGNGVGFELAFDHNEILSACVERLRNKVAYTTLPIHFMPPKFTLPELQKVYEIILGVPRQKAAFRKRMLQAGVIEPTGEFKTEGGRPAELYRAVVHNGTHVFTRLLEGPRHG